MRYRGSAQGFSCDSRRFRVRSFKNDPWAVAKAYNDLLREYRQYFRYIEFAVYCRGCEKENYKAFKEIIRR